MFLPPVRAGTDVTPEPLEPPPIVPPAATDSSPLVPAPPIVPATHDMAAAASRPIDKHDASATSKFDVASLSSSRIDASGMPPVTGAPRALDAMTDSGAAADAMPERMPAGRDSAPLLPPPPNQRAPVKLPGVAPIAERAPAASGDDLAARFGATAPASTAWPGDVVPRAAHRSLRSLVGTPRRIAIAAGALAAVFTVIVFAFAGGDAKPSAPAEHATPASAQPAAASDPAAGTRAGDTAATADDTTAKPDDTTATRDDTTATADGTTAKPDDIAAKPDDTAATPDGTAAKRDDVAAKPSRTPAAAPDHGATHDRMDRRDSPGSKKPDTTGSTQHPTQRERPPTERLSTKPAVKKTTKPVEKPSKKPTWDPNALFPTRKKKKK